MASVTYFGFFFFKALVVNNRLKGFVLPVIVNSKTIIKVFRGNTDISETDRMKNAKWLLRNDYRNSILMTLLIGHAAWKIYFNQSDTSPRSD